VCPQVFIGGYPLGLNQDNIKQKGISIVKEQPEKRALSIAEAARYACVSRGTIENWITKKILPCEELPGRGSGAYRFRRIRKQDLDSFLNQSYSNSGTMNTNTDNESDVFLLPRNS
jgi:excisionase family DNA binding protein